MVAIRERSILNLKRFQTDLTRRVSNIQDRNFNIMCPMLENSNVLLNKPNNLDEIKNTILEISKQFPHRKCAVTYKINENSSIEIQIQPVTETA
jgi:hypothetical protein